jgi:aryl-alcohol dehydrogenase-like predicted oxidoreductase
MRRTIRGTNWQVTAIGLGAMPLSIAGRPSEDEAAQVIRRFVELGGDFIDTANVYCLDDSDIGHNERLIAKTLKALGKRGDEVVVATKGGLRRPRGDWTVDGTPAWLRESCKKSLIDLGVDSIGLYQLHAVDPQIGLRPSIEELLRLQHEGLIRHIGLSNVNLEQLRAALDQAPIVAVQNRCNLLEKRDFRSGLIDFCSAHGLTYIAHSPVGGHHGHVRLPESPLLKELARKYERSTYAIALAWLLAKGEHIIPIPGASKIRSVEDSRQAVHLRLDEEDIAAIDRSPDGV